jgi:hypothetical protein
MASRDNNAEEAAAQAVSRVVGGTYAINDTGSEPGQYDVRITMPNKSTVALEVTSYGGDTWKRTVARIRAESKKGKHSGEDLKYQWWVVVPTGIGISELQPRLGELLARLEAEGKDGVASNFDGDDATLTDVAAALRDLRVNSVNLWDESPPEGQPHILLSQSMRVIGTAGALPGAIAAVFEKDDNQQKLERADADERHLYVVLEDGGSAAVLEGVSPLPACPADPKGVIDTLWVYSPSVSAYLFRTRPGTADWERFVAATGAPAPPK